MKRILKYCLLLPVLIVGILLICVRLNIAGAQDIYYKSRYFRPYAQLLQPQWNNQVIKLKDNRVLLLGIEQSQIFNPYTKMTEKIPGWKSINVFTNEPLLTLLKDGNVLATRGAVRGTIDCYGEGIHNPKFCPSGKVPLLDIKTKKFKWVPYPLVKVHGHSMTVLPDGNVLMVGGNFFNEYDPKMPNQSSYGEFPAGQPYFKNNIVLYNPITYQYKILGHLQVPRERHATMLLNDHEVVVFGGYGFLGNVTRDLGTDYNRQLKSVEVVNFKTGSSKIIGYSSFFPGLGNPVLQLGPNKFFLAVSGLENGYTVSEIYDVKQAHSIGFIKSPNTPGQDDAGACSLLPGSKIVCVGNISARVMDPVKMSDEYIGTMNQFVTFTQPVYIPNVGLLVFGEARYFDLEHPQKTVQIFDYQRYLKDLAERIN